MPRDGADHLIATRRRADQVDRSGLADLDLTFSENVARRFEAARWHVLQVEEGDVDGLDKSLEEAKAEGERPSLVIW